MSSAGDNMMTVRTDAIYRQALHVPYASQWRSGKPLPTFVRIGVCPYSHRTTAPCPLMSFVAEFSRKYTVRSKQRQVRTQIRRLPPSREVLRMTQSADSIARFPSAGTAATTENSSTKRMWVVPPSTAKICFLAFLVAGLCLHTPRAFGDVTYTVDSIADEIDDDTADGLCHTVSNKCTLRAAVMSANEASGPTAMIVLPAGTYVLLRPAPADPADDSGGALKLLAPPTGTTSIVITGAGAASTIIDANQIDRVLSIEQARSAIISGVTFRNGFVAGDGGGINDNSVNLAITNCVVTGNP